MDVRAIVIVGGGETGRERLAGTRLATLDVLGRPVVEHVSSRLRNQGASGVIVVGDLSALPPSSRSAETKYVNTGENAPWRAAETAFSDLTQAGADAVVVLRLGPYIEFNLESLIQFHLDHVARITAVVDASGQMLDYFVISASRRNDAAYLLRSELRQFRSGCERYGFSGYCNRLATAADLRTLAIDAFDGVVSIAPAGKEVKPGVWVGANARIQRGARLLAPCFIGANAKVRANAVVTRCSVIEHHAVIDCGTVLENSTVLPHTMIGAGLDISHSVVGLRKVAHLGRGVEVEITDPKLVSTAAAAPVRALSHAAGLATFIPVQLIKGILARKKAPVLLRDAVQSPSPALKRTAPAVPEHDKEEFSAPFVVARRYGNQ